MASRIIHQKARQRGAAIFREKLSSAADRNSSLLCVGLDPYDVPPELVLDFNRAIIEATTDLVCAYKPNLAIYEGMGTEGMAALERTLEAIPSHIATVGDGKRADIENCGKAYAARLFEDLKFDAVTVNPYMGGDVVDPFLQDKWANRYIFVLCLTSNKSSADFQLLPQAAADGETRPLYLEVARRASLDWNRYGNVGFVVGATFPDGLQAVRAGHPEAIILIPGVGAQGGSVRDAATRAADDRGRGFILSVSRSVIFAEDEPKAVNRRSLSRFATAARSAAQRFRNEINDALALSAVAN
jgi:orotidine-5'-phosphate decarboxylase